MQGKFGSIIFPCGFAGNHVRWLLFLDRQFHNPFGTQDLGSKLKFIGENVYGQDRTWNSWLYLEWKFRQELDKTICIRHDNWQWENTSQERELYLTSSNYLTAFIHYYHINLGLNNSTPEILLQQMQDWCCEFEFVKKNLHRFPNKKIINIDTVFDRKLSKQLYQDIIEFYGFDDNYQTACQVHNMYYCSRQKSARDFYNYFTSENFDNLMDLVYKISKE